MTDRTTLTLTLSSERQAEFKNYFKIADEAMGVLKRRLDELDAQARAGELTHAQLLNGLRIVREAGVVTSTKMLRIAAILDAAEGMPEGGPDAPGGMNGRRLQ